MNNIYSTWCLVVLLPYVIKLSNAYTISQIYGDELLQWHIYVSGPYGSRSYQNGEFFTDFKQSLNGRGVQPNHWPDGINLRSGDSIDAIQVFYGNYKGRVHGWEDGGKMQKIRLYDGDKIVRVTGRSGIGPGATVDQLTFHTQRGLTFGPYGGKGGYPFTAEPPKPECFLAWISGQAHLKVDAIAFHWRCPVLWSDTPKQSIFEDKHEGTEDFSSQAHSLPAVTRMVILSSLLTALVGW